MSTNDDWERWGKYNPYYGVLSDPRFLGKKLTRETNEIFYASGREDIEHLSSRLQSLGIRKNFSHAVDFGCGVGRLSFPLTRIARHVTGLDISPSMIALAKKQVRAKQNKNINFAVTDEALVGLPDAYDLIYSYIVFQHIPPQKQGYAALQKLCINLEEGGCLAIQITFGLDRSIARRALIAARQNVPPVRWLSNMLHDRPVTTPNMRMHSYSMNTVFNTLRANNINECNVEFTNHGDFIGAFIVGQKERRTHNV